MVLSSGNYQYHQKAGMIHRRIPSVHFLLGLSDSEKPASNTLAPHFQILIFLSSSLITCHALTSEL
ncbi:hypothetical protein WG66_002260 [Moniliophthora roreri]|nr:hypothetical protein WG66_002260 [Moniliophthora roreri]